MRVASAICDRSTSQSYSTTRPQTRLFFHLFTIVGVDGALLLEMYAFQGLHALLCYPPLSLVADPLSHASLAAVSFWPAQRLIESKS